MWSHCPCLSFYGSICGGGSLWRRWGRGGHHTDLTDPEPDFRLRVFQDTTGSPSTVDRNWVILCWLPVKRWLLQVQESGSPKESVSLHSYTTQKRSEWWSLKGNTKDFLEGLKTPRSQATQPHPSKFWVQSTASQWLAFHRTSWPHHTERNMVSGVGTCNATVTPRDYNHL